MTLTTHAAIGALLGTTVASPVSGFFLGIALHLLVDVIPHGDSKMSDHYHQKSNKKLALAYVTTDASAAIALLMFVMGSRGDITAAQNLTFAAAVVGSILPDFLVGLGIIFKNRLLKTITRVHFIFHDALSRRYGDVPLSVGLGYQAVFLVFILHRLS
jgi:hypothetical protein